jgi:hypothetical protein
MRAAKLFDPVRSEGTDVGSGVGSCPDPLLDCIGTGFHTPPPPLTNAMLGFGCRRCGEVIWAFGTVYAEYGGIT